VVSLIVLVDLYYSDIASKIDDVISLRSSDFAEGILVYFVTTPSTSGILVYFVTTPSTSGILINFALFNILDTYILLKS
jgi:hypothetical protein